VSCHAAHVGTGSDAGLDREGVATLEQPFTGVRSLSGGESIILERNPPLEEIGKQ